MRDRIERLVVLPFAIGCLSPSSVDVCVRQPRRSRTESYPGHNVFGYATLNEGNKGEEESLSDVNIKSSVKLSSLPKPNITTGFQRLYRGFKNLSQSFLYKEDIEGMDMEMVIGCPTDVKHVTHIGLDGSEAAATPMMGWDILIASTSPPEFLSLSPFSHTHQFELAMAAQANTPPITIPS